MRKFILPLITILVLSVFVASQSGVGGGGQSNVGGGGGVTSASVGAVCGSPGQILYNNGGSCSGDANFTLDAQGRATFFPLVAAVPGFTIKGNGSGSSFVNVNSVSSVQNFSISGSSDLLTIGGSAGMHVNQNTANSDFAGKLTCATSTVTKTFSTSFTSTPVVILFDETTKGGANLTAISNTAFTVSCTGATDALDYIVIGNAN